MQIKEKVESKETKLLKVASADSTSDIGTKRLVLPLFKKTNFTNNGCFTMSKFMENKNKNK